MDRRKFSRNMMLSGLAFPALNFKLSSDSDKTGFFKENPKNLPLREFDVVVAGGGTAGVVAAIAAARQGAKTALIEAKGYTGGTVVEGGTALHSFFNLWKAFPGVEKRQVVKGIAQEIIDRLLLVGGTTGHGDVTGKIDYDCVCTAIDTELYKLVVLEMLAEADVSIFTNTLVAGAVKKGRIIEGVITQSRMGREFFKGKCFIDCTAYGDLSAYAGAEYVELNDHPVCNSMGLGNVNIEKLYSYLVKNNALGDLAYGIRDGKQGQIIRMGSESGYTIRGKLPQEFVDGVVKLGSGLITTTVHDNYLMFIKVNYKLPVSPTNRDEVAKAELIIRQNQFKTLELFRKHLPGCENAFIARTSPSLNIRRGRTITCDYDITLADVIEAKHFDDDIMVYGFHDSAPKYQINNGGTYGVPFKALLVKGIENLLAAGMLITSDFQAHMSTRNTVCCMGQGQAAGTAAALCSIKNISTRDLPYKDLRNALLKTNVYLES
ncbi:MAG TPA: FAD-dependent oxidoreductase [Bacteroidales bacterium]|nr:FAD-dependent oxidoreductase [Bacteroidales bacterium]